MRFKVGLFSCLVLLVFSCVTNATEDPWDIDKDDWTSVMIAVYEDDLNELINLVESGADVNESIGENNYIHTALDVSIKLQNFKIVKYLTSVGADVNNRNINGITPLMKASSLGTDEIVELLLENGADAKALSMDGFTALMAAALGSVSFDIMKTLIDNGSDINAQTGVSGSTALMFAVYAGSPKKVELLIKSGADPTIVDKNMKTADDINEQILKWAILKNKTDEVKNRETIRNLLQEKN